MIKETSCSILNKFWQVLPKLAAGYLSVFAIYFIVSDIFKVPSPIDRVPIFLFIFYPFVLLIIALAFLSKPLVYKLTEFYFKQTRIVLILACFIMVVLMAYANFRSVGGSDAWGVDNSAVTFVKDGQLNFKQQEFFLLFATNYPLLLFDILLVKLTNATAATDKAYLFLHISIHCVLMFLTIFVLYLLSKRVLSRFNQVYFLIIEFIFLGIALRIHDGYNDSFLIVIPVLIVYSFVKFLEAKCLRKRVLFILICSLLFGIGYSIRPTILILLVTIVFAYFANSSKPEFISSFKLKPLFKRFVNIFLTLILLFSLLYCPTSIRKMIVNSNQGLQYVPNKQQAADSMFAQAEENAKNCEEKYSSESCEDVRKYIDASKSAIQEQYAQQTAKSAGVNEEDVKAGKPVQGSELGALMKIGLSFRRLAEGNPDPDLKTTNLVYYFVKLNKFLIQDPSFHIYGEPIFSSVVVNQNQLAKFIRGAFSPKISDDILKEKVIPSFAENLKENPVVVFYNFLFALWKVLILGFIINFILSLRFSKKANLKKSKQTLEEVLDSPNLRIKQFVLNVSVLSFVGLLFATTLMEINSRYLWFFLPLFLLVLVNSTSEVFKRVKFRKNNG